MNTLKANIFMPGQDHNYLVGGNLTGAFALGSLGSTEDFFLLGAEPREHNGYPLLSSNILDSEGSLLCRLDKNELAVNPGHCSKILGLIGVGSPQVDRLQKLVALIRFHPQGVATSPRSHD